MYVLELLLQHGPGQGLLLDNALSIQVRMGIETHCIYGSPPLKGRAFCKTYHAMRAFQVEIALQTGNILSSMADKPGTVSG